MTRLGRFGSFSHEGRAAAMVGSLGTPRSMRAQAPSRCGHAELSGSENLRSVAIRVSRIVEPLWRISIALVRAWNDGPSDGEGQSKHRVFAAEFRSMDRNYANLIRIVTENG